MRKRYSVSVFPDWSFRNGDPWETNWWIIAKLWLWFRPGNEVRLIDHQTGKHYVR